METGLSYEQRFKLAGKVIARAWDDDGYKKRLLASPAEVLREAGFVIPAGAKVTVHEEDEHNAHFVMPDESERVEHLI